MKKINIYLLIGIIIPSLSFLCSCTRENKINYKEIHTYKPEEVKKLFDNALKVEMVGDPVVETSEYKLDSNQTLTEIKTTQTYLIYVGRTKDDHLIPKSEIREQEVEALINDGRGPIVANAMCALACSKDGPACPDRKGCAPDGKGGCTSFNCGSGCETKNCATSFAGFGFGGAIIF